MEKKPVRSKVLGWILVLLSIFFGHWFIAALGRISERREQFQDLWSGGYSVWKDTHMLFGLKASLGCFLFCFL